MPRKQSPEVAPLDEYGLPAVIHTEVLAYLTGVTPRRLHQLITDARIPIECNFSGDKWRTAVALREIFGYYRRQADQRRPSSDRLLETQGIVEDLRAKKLKNAKMARELLPRFVYVQAWGEIINGIKNRFVNFPDKIGPRAFRAKDKVEAVQILEKEIVDIWSGLEDPKFMEEIASHIRDDEFEQPPDTDRDGPSGDRSEGAEDLEPPHS